jgi:LuxR family maltose regulon positive regulatory protein
VSSISVPLLTTKLHIPRARPKLVPRQRLIDRLDEGLKRPLTLISAPAGSGKTTALSVWIPRSECCIAWLSLDEGDNDPTRFWTYFIAALQMLQPELGENAQALLRAQKPEPPPIESFLTVLLNEIAGFPDDLSTEFTLSEAEGRTTGFVLVLDDYHVISNPAIHTGITFLLDHLPAQMHLIIASQADPPLPLARWRARGQLGEIRADDLRFTPEEAATFLNQMMGLDLSASDIAALEARTEGWIAGLQLTALSMQGRTDVTDFIAAFTGSHRYILDYLTEEVLQRQPEEVQSFLLRTCILDRLCGPLCDAVTGETNGQAMLERLERANLFTVRLDDERHWYRYHHLFAEVLRLRLQRAQPDQVPELHRKAAAWSEEHGLIDDAVGHALASGDAAWAARLVEQHVDDVLRRGEGATLRRWLSAIPEQVVRSRPRLSLAQAIAAFNAGRLEEVEPLLADAERALDMTPINPYEPSVGEEASALVNVPAAIALLRASWAGYRGDAERMSELARLALTYLSEDERGPRYSVRWNLALADWMRGRLAEAERTFADIAAEGHASGPGALHLALSAGSILGRVRRAQGRLEEALRTYQDGLEFAARIGLATAPSAGMAHIGMAEVLYERNQLEQALRHAGEGINLGRRLTSTQSLANGLAILAWIRQALGDPAAALAAMNEASQFIPNLEVVALQNPVPAERARLLLVQGDTGEAERWMDRRGLSEEDEPDYPREREYLMLARMLLARKAADRALSLLKRLGSLAATQARNESVIEVQLLEALAFDAVGDQAHAMNALAGALALAEPEGYIRIFVDEGAPMVRLLQQAESRGVTPHYVGQLLAAFGEAASGVAPTARLLPEPLSERELEILRLVAAGLTTREIAAELVIAVGTVRTHLKNIYGKLEAHSRLQAVERARALKLL